MSGGLPIARVLGIVVRLSPAWIVLAGVVTIVGAEQAAYMAPGIHVAAQWGLGALVALGFLLSVIVHELAHAVVGRRVGVTVDQVVVGFAGGIGASVEQAGRPRDDLAIALAGPAVSLLLAAGCVPFAMLAGVAGGPLAAVAGGLIIVGGLNLVLGGLSLLPAVPLDGARAVRALVQARTGDRRTAGRVTARVGRYVGWIALGSGVAVVALGRVTEGLMVLALGWVLTRSSQVYARRLGLEDILRGVSVADAISENGPVVGPNLTIDTFADRYQGEGGVPAIPVVEEGRVLGVVGVRRLQRLGRKRFASTRAGDVMAAPPEAPILAPGDPLWDAAELMDRRGLDGLAVADGSGLRGLVTTATIGRAIRQRVESGGAPVDS